MYGTAEERRLAEVLQNEAVFIDDSLVKRLDFIIAAVTAEKSVDFNYGAAWNKELATILTVLEISREKMRIYLLRKDLTLKRLEEEKGT